MLTQTLLLPAAAAAAVDAGPWGSLVSLWRRLAAAARDTSPNTPSSSSSSSGGGFSPPSSQLAVLITKQLPPATAATAAGAGGGQAGRAVYAVQSSEDEEGEEDQETPAERLVKRFWRVLRVLLQTQLVQKLRKAINPPVTAVFAGERTMNLIFCSSNVPFTATNMCHGDLLQLTRTV
jgi:hypothetical protein